MLRIVSKADTAESFIHIFSHLCDRDSLFIVTRSPKELGTKTRFSINLKTGEPVISGTGEVIERYEGKESPYGRSGMKLRFLDLDKSSRDFIEHLLTAKQSRGTVPTGVPGDTGSDEATMPMAVPLPPNTPASAAAPGADVPQAAQTGVLSGETRVQGSDFILPANPFGELTENVLEAFIECSLYEDANPPVDAPPVNGTAGGEPGLAPAYVSGPVSAQHVVSGRVVTDVSGAMVVNSASHRAPSVPPPPIPVHAQGTGALRASTAPELLPDMTSAAVSAPMYAQRPLTHDPGAAPLSRRDLIRVMILVGVVITLIATSAGLVVGYLLWGGKSTPDAVHQPAAEQAAAASGPAQKAGENASRASSGDAPEQRADPKQPSLPSDQDPDEQDTGEQDTGEQDTDDQATVTSDGGVAAALAGGECQARIISEPEGATVHAGDKELGTTPVDVVLPCGEVELRLTRPRRDPTVETVTLVAGEANEVNVDLKRPMVELKVTSTPPGAEVKVNGRSAGKTPATVKVPGFRNAKVEVKKSGYTTYSERVYAKGPSTSVNAELKRLRKPSKRAR